MFENKHTTKTQLCTPDTRRPRHNRVPWHNKNIMFKIVKLKIEYKKIYIWNVMFKFVKLKIEYIKTYFKCNF